ncbi:MAG TPA: hypothetical protein VEY30_04775 [Myxococcaceae bacterium]|nr:hypothetical protein [Myxococcaceae bacterium]
MNWVRGWVLLGWAAASVAAGCSRSESFVEPVGSEAVSRDGAVRFSIDHSREQVSVTETQTGRPLAGVKVGKAPARLALGPDGTLYVTNRGSRSVSVVAPGRWAEVARIEVGVEPVGVVASDDGRTVYVVNSSSLDQADSGSLMAIDTATRQILWEVPVGKDPRDVQLLPGHKARVTLYLRPERVEVDLRTREVLTSAADLHASR